MRIAWLILALLCLVIVASSGPAQSTTAADSPAAEITGEVALVQGKTGHSADASQVVVWLVPTDPVQHVSTSTDRTRYRLLQHNKRFEPSLLVVPVGSVVDFPNTDPWFHNVFSLYRGKRFDLGLYQAGTQKSVKFDRVGPSYLFCNIHPEMTGVVLAVDSVFFGISDKAGRYSIPGVPPGRYVLHVWYENAKPEALQELQKSVVIEGGNRTLPLISVPVVKQILTEHKNKYGQDYDPDTLKMDY
jgi:plastocyanin